MSTTWIGPFYDGQDTSIGRVGFLIEISNPVQHSTRFDLRDVPAHTNVSNMPQLHGWCGSWNDVSTHACGMAKIVKVARNGRVLVKSLTDEEQAEALEELGYPDLGDEQ